MFKADLREATRSVATSRRRVLVARVKSWWKGHRLPPGNFFQLEPLLASDPKALARKAAEIGPILSSIWGNKITICVTSLPVARRLLQAHRNDLNALSIDIRSIVPKGLLRTMEGADHRTYRRHFLRAISAADTRDQKEDILSIIGQGLSGAGNDHRPNDAVCGQIAIRLLLRTFLGLPHRSEAAREIEDHFIAMAPHGFAWRVGERQRAAFEMIRERLIAFSSQQNEGEGVLPDSVFGKLIDGKAFDHTTIGNLIYMVEMGRADFASFFFRIVTFMGDDWAIFKRIVDASEFDPGVSVAQSVTLETLRMEQSERLMRSAKRDFVFEEFLFPKSAVVRICLWEAHKDAQTFEEPFSFRADRFLNATYTADQFSPFGLGHHQCPAADQTVLLGSLFVETYARWRLSAEATIDRPFVP
jgi:cytochrome P450